MNTEIKQEIKTIEYLGETLESKWLSVDVPVEETKEVQENYYNFDNKLYLKQLKTVLEGKEQRGWVINHINSKHYDKIMGDTKLYHSKWTINEMLQSPDLVNYFIAKTKSNEKVFNKDLLSNFKTVLRLGGKGVVLKPTKFPIKEGVQLLKKYIQHIDMSTEQMLFLDPTAGWGDRLLASLKINLNYFGVDLNPDVVTASNNLIQDIKEQNLMPNIQATVIHGDSTKLISELVNKADIILTSPPYFYLEEYKGEGQATRSDSYEDWVENFIKPFMSNLSEYIKKDRYVLINVTDYKDYTLVEDFKQQGINAGLKFIGFDGLKNIKRTNSKGGFNDNSEDVLVFYKE